MSSPISPAPAGQSGTPKTAPPSAPPTVRNNGHTSMDVTFGRFWPEPRRIKLRHDRALVATAVVVALAAAAILPDRPTGLGWALLLLAGAVAVGRTFWVQVRPETRALAGVFGLLAGVVVVRDAGWTVELCLWAAYLVGAAVLTRARTVRAMITALVALPLAWIRGLPWLARSIPRPWRVRPDLLVVRTVVISGTLLLVFVGLFASADLVFAGWVQGVLAVVPTELPGGTAAVFGGALAVVLGGTYVGLNPPRVAGRRPRPVAPIRRFEWVAPVVSVMAVFTVFLLAQLRALFGGHAYLQGRGLSYAAYVHQGFGQLTVATAIVLLVVGLTLRHAPRGGADRRWVRLLLGLLGGLTLVVVASALFRMQVYAEAYGFTRLRLLVAVFEAWLGLVLLLATTAGVWLRARWVPKVAAVIGVLMIVGFTAANPDAMVAEHNVQRWTTSGRIDLAYLGTLSADAVPALDALPEPMRTCALRSVTVADSHGLSWNLGRARAEAVLAARPLDPAAVCRG